MPACEGWAPQPSEGGLFAAGVPPSRGQAWGCEPTVSGGLPGVLAFLGLPAADLLFQGAGAGGRAGLFGCHLDPIPFAFHKCNVSGDPHTHGCCHAFGLHLDRIAGLGALSSAFINHGPVIALQAVPC